VIFSGLKIKKGIKDERGFYSDLNSYESEYLEINFINQKDFSLEGKKIWYKDSYDSGDITYTYEYTGSGNYEIIKINEDEKSFEIKLIFSYFSELDKNNRDSSEKFSETEDLLLNIHIFEVKSEHDFYLESNQYFNLLVKKNLYDQLGIKERSIFERLGYTKEDSKNKYLDYFKENKSRDDLIYISILIPYRYIDKFFEKHFPNARYTDIIYNIF